jgi:hypothetical protein
VARAFVIASSQKIQRSTATLSAYPYTLGCWVRPSAVNVTQTAIGIAAANITNHIALGILSTAKPFLETITVGSSGLAQHGTSATANTWGHLLAVGTSATSRAVYWNGTSGTVDTANTAFPTLTRTAIGLLPETTDVSKYGGDIAEVGFWNVVLNADEISALAGGFSPQYIRPASLQAYLPLLGYATEIDIMGGAAWAHTNTPTISDHCIIFRPPALVGQARYRTAGSPPATPASKNLSALGVG